MILSIDKNMIGKTATFQGLSCKIVGLVQGKTKVVAMVVYPEIQVESESASVVWGTKKYSVCIDNLIYD